MFKSYQKITIFGKAYNKEGIEKQANGVINNNLSPEWEKNVYRFIQEWVSDDEVLELKTSGSTGIPKIVTFEKDKLIKSALLTKNFLNLKEGDTAITGLPIDYIAGKMMVVRAFVIGFNLILLRPSSRPLRQIQRPLDFAAMTPMQLHNTAIRCNSLNKLNNIKNLIIGGGVMNDDLLLLASRLKNNTYQTYGMTETLTHIAMKKLNNPGKTDHYIAMDQITFETDKDNRLIIHAPHLSNEPILSNDVVEFLSETSFNYVGRFDQIINSGGIKIFPEKVEEKIRDLTNRRLYVCGTNDDILGEKVMLVLEGDEFETTVLKNDMKIRLKKYEIPKEICFVEKFHETESGKIIRVKII